MVALLGWHPPARPRAKELYGAEQVDAICTRLERAADRKQAHNASAVRRQAAERDLLRECEVARDLLYTAVAGEKRLLAEVFGGDCERFHRMRAVLGGCELLENNAKDQRWKGFREQVDTVEEVLKELGLYKAWMRGPPETLTYRIPEFLEPGVVVHYQPAVEGNCSLSSLCYVLEPDLPHFLMLDPSTGEIHGRPKIGVPVPTTNYIVRARNNFGAAVTEVTFGVQVPRPEEVTYLTTRLVVGRQFEWEAQHLGGRPNAFAVTPGLPRGLELDPKSGVISGIPVRQQGEEVFRITASNVAGSVECEVEIVVLAAAPSGLTYPDLLSDLQAGGNVYLVPEVVMASVTYSPDERMSNVVMRKRKTAVASPSTKWGFSFVTTGLSIGKKWGRVRIKNWENILLQGCAPDLDFVVDPPLPEGLHLSRKTGIISGRATEVLPKRSYKITASNEAGKSSIDVCFGVVSSPPRGLVYDDIPKSLHVGQEVSCTPVVEGLVDEFTVTPELPPGLSLDPALGTLSGAPRQAVREGRWTIQAKNEAGVAKATVTLVVRRLGPTSLVYRQEGIDRAVGQHMEITAEVDQDVDSFTVDKPLPAGLRLDPRTGAISGTPEQVTAFDTYTVTAANESGSAKVTVALEIRIVPPDSLCYPSVDEVYDVGEALDLAPSVHGGAASWSVEPSLPDGIVLDTGSGRIAGAPKAQTQERSYTVTASNEAGGTSVVLTFEVIGAAPQGLSYPVAVAYTVGAPVYLQPVLAGGQGGAAFAVEPELPAGFRLDACTGVISGTPSAVAPEAAYTVTAASRAGCCSTELKFGVEEAPTDELGIDQAFAAQVEEATDAAQLPPEPPRARRLGDWMIWMVHRAYLNDPTLDVFDFTCLKMPLPHKEPRIAPKLCAAMATNSRITSLLLADTNFRAPQAHQLGESFRKNKALNIVNLESNFIDGEGIKAIARALQETPDAAVETLRLSNQAGTDVMGRTVEQAVSQMMQANPNITRLGFVAVDPHWNDTINRALLKNADAARRRRKGLEAVISEVNRVQRTLAFMELMTAPQSKAAWEVFEDSDPKMTVCRAFCAEKRRLPSSQHLQGFARNRGVALGYAAVSPLLRDFTSKLFDASVGAFARCEDSTRNTSSGTLSAWSEKNNRWSFHVDAPGDTHLEFQTDRQPVVVLSADVAEWLAPPKD